MIFSARIGDCEVTIDTDDDRPMTPEPAADFLHACVQEALGQWLTVYEHAAEDDAGD